ncbi:peptidase [Dictyobacter sp. S3.2.2.5]|uniref:Peptidase n=1 Tax=Dictyobacter halimunensis TaxID=3026934 RepID=A0ABQ6FNC5_9CHLR|nr:peptidase [Dictyobacter sp. S3.2.2.5]
MSQQPRRIHPLLVERSFLSVLACAYVVYLVVFGPNLYSWVFPSSDSIVDHHVDTTSSAAVQHWTVAAMRNATEDDVQNGTVFSQILEKSSVTRQSKATLKQGQPPRDGGLSYPLSTVGKVFFTNDAGMNMSCSGTAVTSRNRSVVDTAGHCLYQYGEWMQNVIFCPQYDNGDTPYGCWAAHDLEVPSEWIDAKPNNFHHDFGMAIVAANNQGLLTDVVGGAGWAYNQPVDQAFYAYGYPAMLPFDGQTRQSCEGASGTSWKFGEGNVVSIPCNMNGGSSGGPWFIKIGDAWYLNGHNDFISSRMPGHMFSPYYDDTWYTLYSKASA